jgi:hypothetical protein
MTPAILDTQWSAFREIAEQQQKLGGSSVDWAEAYFSWRMLDAFQKQAAIEHLRACNDMTTTHSTPQSYLNRRKFERPLPVSRPVVKEQPKALDGALARLQREVKR